MNNIDIDKIIEIENNRDSFVLLEEEYSKIFDEIEEEDEDE